MSDLFVYTLVCFFSYSVCLIFLLVCTVYLFVSSFVLITFPLFHLFASERYKFQFQISSKQKNMPVGFWLLSHDASFLWACYTQIQQWLGSAHRMDNTTQWHDCDRKLWNWLTKASFQLSAVKTLDCGLAHGAEGQRRAVGDVLSSRRGRNEMDRFKLF